MHADLETPCAGARPTSPRKLCRSSAPRARPLILQSKPEMVSWNSIRRIAFGEIARRQAGARAWTLNFLEVYDLLDEH